jgi:hypothetical protein
MDGDGTTLPWRPVGPEELELHRQSGQAIREDRILHEAHATSGDVLPLIDLSGLSVEGAQRYTATVDHPAIGPSSDHRVGAP